MTDQQWNDFLRVMQGELLDSLPVGFIIDCPWLPGWCDMSVLDYLGSERKWLEANRRAIDTFPDILFVPGYWSEYGMCTEPSAFGARCIFPEDDFPFPQKIIGDDFDVDRLPTLIKPDPRTDGLCPLIIKRMELTQKEIEAAGHRVRFATCRGPLNIATYLLGHSEFLMGLMTDPEGAHRMLDTVTEFLVDWLQYQKERFPTIEAMLVLDDIIGFVGGQQFTEFVMPYMQRISKAIDVPVRMLHNDAMGILTAENLLDMGYNVFNFAFDISLPQARELAGEEAVLFGNMPPRDVLAAGTPDDVRQGVQAMLDSIEDRRRIIYSCGGGMPPNVSTENIRAFLEAMGH